MNYGISEFVCQYNGFNYPELHCVFKRLYSDFVVIEIDFNGHILLPGAYKQDTDLSIIENEKLDKDEAQKKECDDIFNEPLEKIPRFIGGEIIEKIDIILKEESDNFVEMDVKDMTKENRKKIYQFLSMRFGKKLKTNCKDGVLLISRMKTGDPVYSVVSYFLRKLVDQSYDFSDRERSRWPKDRGNYLHFTLTKMNMEVSYALKVLARKAGLNPRIFSTAGTKDRRGITSQRISAYRADAEKLAKFANSIKNVWLSCFDYSKEQINLGCLSGNHFSIVLREFSLILELAEFEKRVKNWEKFGFLNYFGFQRFGSFGLNTSEIGRLILLQDWEQATKMILSPNRDIDSNSQLYHCLCIFQQTNDPDKALAELGCETSSSYIEHTILRKLSALLKNKNVEENHYKSAILALPRETRSLYVHSYQSFLFNRIISRRLKKYGFSVLPGDLDLKGQPLLFDESDKLPKIEDVYLPLFSGNYSDLPKNEIDRWYSELLVEDKLSPEIFSQIDKSQFIIGRAYRPFIVIPKSVSWEFIEYMDLNEELQSSDFIPTGIIMKSKSIAPVIVQGSDELGRFDIKEVAAEAAAIPVESCQKEKLKPEEQKSCENNKPKRRALKISFDLPPGSYATMALRELLLTDLTKFVQRAREF